MGTRSVEANQGITPTIAHVPTGIVHGQPLAKARFEKVPVCSPKIVLNSLKFIDLSSVCTVQTDFLVSSSGMVVPLPFGSIHDGP
jgi:hypothetical protein